MRHCHSLTGVGPRSLQSAPAGDQTGVEKCCTSAAWLPALTTALFLFESPPPGRIDHLICRQGGSRGVGYEEQTKYRTKETVVREYLACREQNSFEESRPSPLASSSSLGPPRILVPLHLGGATACLPYGSAFQHQQTCDLLAVGQQISAFPYQAACDDPRSPRSDFSYLRPACLDLFNATAPITVRCITALLKRTPSLPPTSVLTCIQILIVQSPHAGPIAQQENRVPSSARM